MPAVMTYGRNAELDSTGDVDAVIMNSLENGIYRIHYESVINLNASAGANVLQTSAVPAGYYWALESASCVNTITGPATINFYLTLPTGRTPVLEMFGATAAAFWRSWSGLIIMPPGTTARVNIAGCLAGDDLYFEILAHTIRFTP